MRDDACVNRRWFVGPRWVRVVTLLILVGGVALFVFALAMSLEAMR